jgi:hypothetical protein
MEEILRKFDPSHQQIHSREEYAEMAKYLSDLAEGIGLDKKKSNKDYYINRSCILLKSDSSADFLVLKKFYDEATDEDGDVDMMKIKKLCPKEDVFSVIPSSFNIVFLLMGTKSKTGEFLLSSIYYTLL